MDASEKENRRSTFEDLEVYHVRYLRDQKNSMGTASVREMSPTYDDIEELDDDSRLSI
jgi:hypothetical protein